MNRDQIDNRYRVGLSGDWCSVLYLEGETVLVSTEVSLVSDNERVFTDLSAVNTCVISSEPIVAGFVHNDSGVVVTR